MTIEYSNGYTCISKRTAHGNLVKRRYMGYTLTECKAMFNEDFRNEL
jgi:hypothetical protein